MRERNQGTERTFTTQIPKSKLRINDSPSRALTPIELYQPITVHLSTRLMLAGFELVEKLRAGPFDALNACSGQAFTLAYAGSISV